MAEPAGIVFDAVGVAFGVTEVLDGVSFDVAPGGISALIGPNGAGKSTLLRAVVRLLGRGRFTGKLLIDGEDAFGPHVDVVKLRRRAVLCPAEPVALPGSIRSNVVFALMAAGGLGRNEVDERLEAALRATGLWEELSGRLDAQASGLDRAQIIRLGIARALVLQPALLLLDEPTADVDAVQTARVEEIVHGLRGRTTVIVATNDLAQAGRLADTTAFLDGGRVVEVGRTEDLFTRPRKVATENWLSGRSA